MNQTQRCHNERETAQILGISTKTLQAWRWKSKGPVYVKMGRRVGYPDIELQEYMKKCRIEPTNT